MGNMHLVTGHAGSTHIAAEDLCDQNISIVGEEDFVVDDGGFSATNTGNTVRITAGRLFMCGRFVRSNSTITLRHSAVGISYYRTDLIAARYTRNTATGVEEVSLVIIDGDPSQSPNPEGPEIFQDDLRKTGTILYEMPLFKVSLGGGNVTVTPVAARKKPFGAIADEIKKIRIGTATIQYSDEESHSTAVVFSGFSEPPLVLFQQAFNKLNILAEDVTANGFTALVPPLLDGSGRSGSRDITWIAIGE